MLGHGLGLWRPAILGRRGASPTVPSGLVAYYSLDTADITAPTVRDVNPNAFGPANMTMVSAPTTGVAGQIAQGVTFDGSTQYASVTSAVVSTMPLTMMAWVRLTSVPTVDGTDNVALAIANTTALDDFWLGFYKPAGVPVALRSVMQNAGGANNRSFRGTITADTNWHHVAVAFVDATTQAVYLDGVQLTGTYDITGTPAAPTGLNATFINHLTHSTATQYGYLPGTIDDARFYSRALSGAEITSIYNAGLAGNR